jgi:phosphoribosylaminoimidazolecarboxamide formyltransferase/IMP cyclohydrolase
LNKVSSIDNRIKINKVLISVFDKSGLDNFVKQLVKINPDIVFYSTGGTYEKIKTVLGRKSEKHLLSISDYTGQPEMQGGLVKTLDFKIYLGLLSETYNEHHNDDIKRLNAVNFDMAVVNLYPFKDIIKNKNIDIEDARSNIDIGGPAMLRASAKNYIRTASVSSSKLYRKIIQEMKEQAGTLSLETRYSLALNTFKTTSEYDRAIFRHLSSLDVKKEFSVYRTVK